MNGKNKTVMVFGVFDGLHNGHKYFLKEARKHGEKLIVAVAQNEAVFRIKYHFPKFSVEERIEALSKLKFVTKAIQGDDTEGLWKVVWEIRPDIIAFGYDQKRLYEALLKDQKKFPWPIEFITINSHHPDKFHSSIL